MVPLRWVHAFPFIIICSVQFSLVQFSCSNSLRPHRLQHVRPPCPSPTPGAYSNSCPWSRWCHPSISSSVVQFSSCLQSFPASESFQTIQFFASGGRSIGVSASVLVLPMNIHDLFPWGLLVWSPCSPRDSQESSPAPQFKSIYSSALRFLFIFFSFIFISWRLITLQYCSGSQVSLWSNSHIHTWLVEKP